MEVSTLLENMSGKINCVGTPVKAIGYNSYKTSSRLNTISIHTTNFVGHLYIQGSLKENPNPFNKNDWFIIPLTDTSDYIEYNDYIDNHPHPNTKFINLKGSYTWIRAIMDRSSYMNVIQTPTKPWDFNPSDILNDESSPQNEKDYYSIWKENINPNKTITVDSKKIGNINKILLCF